MSALQDQIKNSMPIGLNHVTGRNADASTPRYEYERLQVDRKEIRLLEICAADDPHEVIEVKLWHVEWNDKPRYAALSYTWGRSTEHSPLEWDDPTFMMQILVNGCLFDIRPNLFHALSALRPSLGGKSAFWIDAICINQTDSEEKSVQVQRMKDIYRDSAFTMVWLGPADESTPAAFRKIKHISNSWQRRPPALRCGPMPVSVRHTNEYLKICIEELGGHEPLKSWEGIRALLNRNWWRRAWVLQEICAAPGALVMVGPCVFDWTDIVNVSNAISQHLMSASLLRQLPMSDIQKFIPILYTCSNPLRYIEQLNEVYCVSEKVGMGLPLEMVLQRLRTTRAADARDKVFAGLSLSSEGALFPVDYQQSPVQVFTRLAHYFIKMQKALTILGYCKYPPRLQGLPSWVPDWTDESCEHFLPLPRPGPPNMKATNAETHLFRAGGPLDNARVFVNEDEGRIVVEAAIVDEIAFVALRPHRNHKFTEAAQHAGAMTDELVETHIAWSKGRRMQDVNVVLRYEWLHQWAIHEQHGSHAFEKILKNSWQYNDAAADIEQFSELTYAPTDEPLCEAYYRTLCANTLNSIESNSESIADRTASFVSQIKNSTDFQACFSVRIHERVLAVTTTGYLALVPENVEVGDLTCIVLGNDVPLVLRPTGDGMAVVGECYVHGIMEGEMYEYMRGQDCFGETILI